MSKSNIGYASTGFVLGLICAWLIVFLLVTYTNV